MAGARQSGVLTEALDVSVSDQAGDESGEGLVDVVASLPADPQAAKAVQPGNGALDDPTENAQARAVLHASLSDDRTDAALPQQAPVRVVVVAAADEQRVGPMSGPADDTGHRRDLAEQGQEPGDVVAVPRLLDDL